MRMLSTLALGAALSLAALPALAQTATSPGTSTTTPNNSAVTQPGSGASSSTTITNDRAPPAGSGTRALTPGQNADGTPTNQSPGGQPQLPGMKGQGK